MRLGGLCGPRLEASASSCPSRGLTKAASEYIDDLECGIEALQTELAVTKGEDIFERLTPTEIEEWLGDDGLPN